MSRRLTKETTHTEIIRGSDHACGRFVQVTDSRYAGSKEDYQGEGYVLDHDNFGFSTNLIGATEADVGDDERLIQLTNEFINRKNLN